MSRKAKETVDCEGLVIPAIAHLHPYEPGKPIEELERELGDRWPPGGVVKLASNENPLGPSPRAVAAMSEAVLETQRYPDGSAFRLRRRLAARLGVAEREVLVGAGSNELIDLLVQTFCRPEEEVLAPAFSFACYRLSALGHGRRFREADTGPHFAYSIERLLEAVRPETKLVFLANPNNPTGAYLPRPEFCRLLEALPPKVILVVDEAYHEYADAPDYPDALKHRGERERLVALRTFSKIHGLAGARVGYGVLPAAMAEYVHRVRLPFNVSSIAQAGALGALEDDEHVERSRSLNAREKAKLQAGLAALGIASLPSHANFVLADLGARSGRDVYRALLERGIIVRPVDNYGLPHHLRITVGTETENSRLRAALAEVLEGAR